MIAANVKKDRLYWAVIGCLDMSDLFMKSEIENGARNYSQFGIETQADYFFILDENEIEELPEQISAIVKLYKGPGDHNPF